MKKIIVVLLSASLVGCVGHFPMHPASPSIAPMHHKVKKPVVVVPPVVVIPPVAPVVPKKKTFKERWESKFFRDRALMK